MFPEPFVSNGIAYVPAFGTAVIIYTSTDSDAVDLEIASIAAVGTFLDGTAVAWAEKLIGGTFITQDGGATYLCRERGTATVIWGSTVNTTANNLGFNTLGPLTLVVSTGRLVPVLDTGVVDNLAVAATYNTIVPTTTGSFSVTGFAGSGVNGTVLIVSYPGNSTDDMTLVNASSASAAGNRIFTNTGSDIVTTDAGSVTMVYDTTLDSGNGGWRVIAAAL